MPALVTPKELVQGGGRGQKLKGRILGLQTSVKGGKELLQCYLVTEKGLDGMLMLEAWRECARTTKAIIKENQIVEVSNLTVKALGDKVQWQCTSLDVFGQILAATQFKPMPDDDQVPFTPGTVLVEDLAQYRRVAHLINVAGIVVDIQVLSLIVAFMHLYRRRA